MEPVNPLKDHIMTDEQRLVYESMYQAQEMMNAIADDVRVKSDSIILLALQKQIPEITLETISDYAHRLSVEFNSSNFLGYDEYMLDGVPILLIKREPTLTFGADSVTGVLEYLLL